MGGEKMQADFHYYATYCAAFLAGCPHEESLLIAYCSQLTDCCTRSFLKELKAPLSAATTQNQTELMDAPMDLLGLQEITRIWSSFHFLPRDLYAKAPEGSPSFYRNKYRLICGPNGELLLDTVHLAKGKGPEAAGLAMHILADTWAHRYFAGTPSLVINNTNYAFEELLTVNGKEIFRPLKFRHSPSLKDDIEQGIYVNTLYQTSESTVMNLGHGRAGHLPDYSFIRYRYMPAWGRYTLITKDNPHDYRLAFCQMVHALKFLNGNTESFIRGFYDFEALKGYEETVSRILCRRQTDASADWKAFGESLSGQAIPDFDESGYREEYLSADAGGKDGTVLGRYILAALAQKSMVTNKIARSKNPLAGISVEYDGKKLPGIRDYLKLIRISERGKNDKVAKNP